MTQLVIGYDHGFGRGRSGDVGHAAGDRCGSSASACDVVEAVSARTASAVSSTRIRERACSRATWPRPPRRSAGPTRSAAPVVRGDGRGTDAGLPHGEHPGAATRTSCCRWRASTPSGGAPATGPGRRAPPRAAAHLPGLAALGRAPPVRLRRRPVRRAGAGGLPRAASGGPPVRLRGRDSCEAIRRTARRRRGASGGRSAGVVPEQDPERVGACHGCELQATVNELQTSRAGSTLPDQRRLSRRPDDEHRQGRDHREVPAARERPGQRARSRSRSSRHGSTTSPTISGRTSRTTTAAAAC